LIFAWLGLGKSKDNLPLRRPQPPVRTAGTCTTIVR
jgi:hypothetical protein